MPAATIAAKIRIETASTKSLLTFLRPARLAGEFPPDLPDAFPDALPAVLPDVSPVDLPDNLPDVSPVELSGDFPDDSPTDLPDDFPDYSPVELPDDFPDGLFALLDIQCLLDGSSLSFINYCGQLIQLVTAHHLFA